VKLAIVVLIAGHLAVGGGCKQKATPEERATYERIVPMIAWIEDFNTSNQRYPDNWAELLAWKGQPMPINVYTNEPMIALDSKDFDPKKSPGNFFYARVIRNDEVTNFQLLVFGKDGIIVRYSHSPLAAK
jgi:hypothetical protein